MKLYFHLAWDGIRKNRRLYVPYLLTGVGAAALFYILLALANGPVAQMTGGDSLSLILRLGSFVLAIFSALLLFYTNSFLIRRRNREFALYNVLGMGKGNIARILVWETLLSAGIALLGGLTLGAALSKLAELALTHLMGGEISYSYPLSGQGALLTALFFAAIYVLILLVNIVRIRAANPAQLLRSEAAGEKPPRANWLLGAAGLVLLGAAYWLAVSIRQPLTALVWFFIAVVIVILATYLLFIAGSVVLCRLLQKNKRFYYQKSHFVSVSSMAYRMKRNGAGLASICILATMVLVMLSSTTCLYSGIEDSLRTRYPRNITVTAYYNRSPESFSKENIAALRAQLLPAVEGAAPENVLDYRQAFLSVILDSSGEIHSDSTAKLSDYEKVCCLSLIGLDDYNAMTGGSETLAPNEVLVSGLRMGYSADTLTIEGGPTWRVKAQLTDAVIGGERSADVTPTLYVIVPDLDTAMQPLEAMAERSGGNAVSHIWTYAFDTKLSNEEQIRCTDSLGDLLSGIRRQEADDVPSTIFCEGVASNRDDFYATYGGLFFLGVLLSVGFSLAAVLIIYYKQISEGYEDEARFAIMQKVGMTRGDIRRSVNSQMLLVFFLPLLLAGLHLCFAFPFVHKLLMLFNLNNVKLLIGTTALSYVVFALLYTLAYRLTSNAYYQIVSGARED